MKTTWGQGEQSLQVVVSGLIDWGGAAGGAGPENLIRGKCYCSRSEETEVLGDRIGPSVQIPCKSLTKYTASSIVTSSSKLAWDVERKQIGHLLNWSLGPWRPNKTCFCLFTPCFIAHKHQPIFPCTNRFMNDQKKQDISQRFILTFLKIIQKLFNLKSSKLTNLLPYMVYCHQVKFKVL